MMKSGISFQMIDFFNRVWYNTDIEKLLVFLIKSLFTGDNMSFFITESQRKQRGGTCYFEFQKGQRRKKYKEVFWREDSLLLHMDIVDEVALYRIIPDFNYYGITIIDEEKWNIIQNNAKNESGKAAEVIDELRSWVEGNYKEYDYFVILGI